MQDPITLKLTDQEAALIVQSLASMLARDPTGLGPITPLLGSIQASLTERAKEASAKAKAKAEKAEE